MPKFKSLQHAHDVHKDYNVDTDAEGKYNMRDPYHIGRNRIKFMLDNVPHDSHVLEIGCNSGGILRLLSSENKCYCNGIDISKSMVERAKVKGIHAQVGVAEYLPFETSTFDVVVMTEIIEHLYDPNTALKEAKRVLKPGGLFIGSVPHKDSQNSTRKSIDDHQWHHKIFTEEEIKELVSKFFSTVSLTNIPWYNDQEHKPQWMGFTAHKLEVN